MKPNGQQVGGRYSKYALGVLLVVYIFNFIDRQIISILAEEIKADLGISDAEIGFLYGTAFAVFYAVFGIPLGKLADVWTRKSLISIGLAFWSLMTALSGTARSFAALAAYRFGVGVGEASASPAAFSMLSDYFSPKVRATVLAIYSSGVYIGAGIGLFLGGVIVDAWKDAFPDPAQAPFGLKGWQAAFFAVGLPGLLVAVWMWTLREPVRGMSEGLVVEAEPHPFRETLRSLQSVLPPFTALNLLRLGGLRALGMNLIAALAIAAAAYGANVLMPSAIQWVALGIGVYAAVSWVQALKIREADAFAMMFRSKAFVLASVGFPCLSFVSYGVGFWGPPFMLRVHNVELAEAGIVMGLAAAIGGWLGVTLGGVLSDRLKARTTNARLWIGVMAGILSLPSGFVFLLTDSTWVAYLAVFVFSITSPMWVGGGASTVNDLVMPHMRATASAYYILMITFVGLALGPFMIGQISDAYIASGLHDGLALRNAMMWSFALFGASTALLLLGMRYLPGEEAARNERVRLAAGPAQTA
ncbi:MAG: MFS transporter [Gammaproteobacteria bacterium]|nr:MFS transporter [Gammaproteobacteria bacterium]